MKRNVHYLGAAAIALAMVTTFAFAQSSTDRPTQRTFAPGEQPTPPAMPVPPKLSKKEFEQAKAFLDQGVRLTEIRLQPGVSVIVRSDANGIQLLERTERLLSVEGNLTHEQRVDAYKRQGGTVIRDDRIMHGEPPRKNARK